MTVKAGREKSPDMPIAASRLNARVNRDTGYFMRHAGRPEILEGQVRIRSSVSQPKKMGQKIRPSGECRHVKDMKANGEWKEGEGERPPFALRSPFALGNSRYRSEATTTPP
jgi:hypothetical protein